MDSKMKCFIYGRKSYGDEIILSVIRDSLKLEYKYLGERVDLSKIDVQDENLIMIINSYIFNMDLDKIYAYINKDLSKPLVVVRKIKTFAALSFKPNLELDTITTNKLYIFAGILYLPKQYYKKTMSEIFKTMDKKDLRIYFVTNRDRKSRRKPDDRQSYNR